MSKISIYEMTAEELENAINYNILHILPDLAIYGFKENWDYGYIELVEKEIEQLEKITNTSRKDLTKKLENKLDYIYRYKFDFDFAENEEWAW